MKVISLYERPPLVHWGQQTPVSLAVFPLFSLEKKNHGSGDRFPDGSPG